MTRRDHASAPAHRLPSLQAMWRQFQRTLAGRGSVVVACVLCILCSASVPRIAAAGPSACAGDCGGDGMVTIDDLIVGVAIALEQRDLSACLSLDVDGSGNLTINELIIAVTNALTDCGGGGSCESGLRALAAGNLVAARDAFAAAAAAHPEDGACQLFALFSRLGVELITDQRLLDILNATGAHLAGSVDQACSYRITERIIVPPTAPRLDQIADATGEIFGAPIAAALGGLQSAIDADTAVPLNTTSFPSCVKPPVSLPVLDIDRSDFMATRAALLAGRGLLELGGAYHIEIALHDLFVSSISAVLAADANLLTLRSGQRLSAARDAFDAALQQAVAAVAAMRAETDSQDDDLLVVMPEDAAYADRLVQLTDLIRQSLHGEVVIPAQEGLPRDQRLNLSRFFDGSLPSLRQFMSFDADGNVDIRHFPDPTFGGVTPDLTQADIDELIDGGRLCIACQQDDDCAGLGPRSAYCGTCDEACTGPPMRCTSGFTECLDGVYD